MQGANTSSEHYMYYLLCQVPKINIKNEADLSHAMTMHNNS
jgi:hypothetical protein